MARSILDTFLTFKSFQVFELLVEYVLELPNPLEKIEENCYLNEGWVGPIQTEGSF